MSLRMRNEDGMKQTQTDRTRSRRNERTCTVREAEEQSDRAVHTRARRARTRAHRASALAAAFLLTLA